MGHTYLRIFGYYGDFCARVIIPFCRAHLYKVGKVPVPGTNKQAWKVTHVFAQSNHDKTEYRIPATLMKEFIEFAQYRGYNTARIAIETEPEIEGADCEFQLRPEMSTPLDHQVEWLDYQLADGGVKVNNAPTGGGKALANDTPVRTIHGWRPIGQIKVNDLVMAPDGSHTYVTGVFPQGMTRAYRLQFEDGRVIVACPDHQWEVRAKGETEWQVLTTQQMVDSGKTWYIPLTASERNPDRGDIIEPYLIGKTDRILGEKYLEGSHSQRMALLRGLLDNGGEPQLDGSIVFKTEYGITAKMVRDLVRSIGGIAEAKFKKFKNSVILRHRTPEILFTDEVKQDKLRNSENRDLALKILQIVETEPTETTCIAVEHPSHCFVVKDYIVTHNTYMGLYTAVQLGKRVLITVQPRYITTWVNDIEKTLITKPGDVIVWENASLPLLGENIEKGLLNPKIVIVPFSRISLYLRNNRKDPHAVSLSKIFEQINAGYRIVDEGHESFHEVALSMFHGNHKKMVTLTATLKADDPFMNKMYNLMLPISIRLKEPEPENYINIVAYMYHLCQRKFFLKTMQFGSYNDMALEASILRSPVLTEFYFKIAKKAFDEYYYGVGVPGDYNFIPPTREEGTKCLFFFSRIEMCETMLAMFQKVYPDLDFCTFLGTKDKKTPTKYLEHEIVITTPGSCGTGKDIPGLVTTICFHTVFSTQRNKQMIGRLRQFRGKFAHFNGRITPTFVFPFCNDLGKHQECFQKRRIAFANKEKDFKLIESNCSLN